jgi:hypothetical protein
MFGIVPGRFIVMNGGDNSRILDILRMKFDRDGIGDYFLFVMLGFGDDFLRENIFYRTDLFFGRNLFFGISILFGKSIVYNEFRFRHILRLICAEHSPVAEDNPFNPVFFGFGIVQDLNQYHAGENKRGEDHGDGKTAGDFVAAVEEKHDHYERQERQSGYYPAIRKHQFVPPVLAANLIAVFVSD